MAFSVSPARPEVSATRSCESRDRRRTRRPNSSMGASTVGISAKMMSASLRLVSSSSTSEPRKLTVGAQQDRQTDAGQRLDQRGVGSQAREHLAGLGDLEERRVHADHAVIDGAAQVGDHALADPVHQVHAQAGERGEHRGGRQQQQEIAVDGGGVGRA